MNCDRYCPICEVTDTGDGRECPSCASGDYSESEAYIRADSDDMAYLRSIADRCRSEGREPTRADIAGLYTIECADRAAMNILRSL